jgi:hypothetical protein
MTSAQQESPATSPAARLATRARQLHGWLSSEISYSRASGSGRGYALLEHVEGLAGLTEDGARDAVPAAPLLCVLVGGPGDRPVDAHKGVGEEPGLDVPGAGAGFLGDDLGEGVGGAGCDLLLAGLQRGAAGDDPGRPRDPRDQRWVVAGERSSRLEHMVAERGEHASAGRAMAYRAEQLLLVGLHAAVDQVFLGGEVGERDKVGEATRRAVWGPVSG